MKYATRFCMHGDRNMLNRNCPVCGGKHAQPLRKIQMKIPADYHLPSTYDVVRCERCGMVYADTKASMGDYDWYYTHCNFYGDDSKDDNTLRYEMVKDFLEKYCNRDSRLVDIGAGNGRFELALREHGYRHMVAIDPSPESVERLARQGIEAQIGSIYSEVSPDEQNTVDCVFLFEVAEHLLCPGIGVDHVCKLLKKEGYFIISVPDYSQIAQDQSEIPNYFNLEHINYFSEFSLDNLMRMHGMHRVDQKWVGCDLIHCYQYTEVCEPLQEDHVTGTAVETFFAAKQEKEQYTRNIIAQLKEQKKKIIIWGTGSYVMSLIAETELLDCEICGFVDNNKLKQGRQMYGYNVYEPEFVLGTDVTILICSMLYADVIRSQIRAMGADNEIVVL